MVHLTELALKKHRFIDISFVSEEPELGSRGNNAVPEVSMNDDKLESSGKEPNFFHLRKPIRLVLKQPLALLLSLPLFFFLAQ